LGVDVGALEVTECGDPYARGREGGEKRTMLEVARRQQPCLDLVAPEDDGERLGLLGVRDIVHHPRTAQGRLVEKAEGTHGLDKDALGDLLVEKMELRGADVLSAEAIRRDVEVCGALGHVAQIPIDGVGRVVANRPIFEHAPT
jgi:hypothetical protein